MGAFNFLKKKKTKELKEKEKIKRSAMIEDSLELVEKMSMEVEKPPLNIDNAQSRMTFVKEGCEQIIEVSKQIEEAKIEYQAVTSYLTDMQKIDAIPAEEREVVDDAARKIITLTRERSKFQSNRNIKISDKQYKHLEKYETQIPSEIVKMRKNEEYNIIVKNDMRNLEGEKGALHFQKEEIIKQQKYLKGLAIITSVIVASLFVLFYVIADVFYKDMTIPYMLTIAMAAVSAAYIFYEARRNIYEVKLAEKKLDRAITLLNKVKIKYINTTSLLDYSYSKYTVNISGELNYLWEQYMKAKDEEKRYKNNTDLLNFYNEHLIELLKGFKIADADIWIYQALAIIDNKEMVEVRHRLNVRRQKLRDRIDYNTKLKDSSVKDMEEIITKKPETETEVRGIVAGYHISI